MTHPRIDYDKVFVSLQAQIHVNWYKPTIQTFYVKYLTLTVKVPYILLIKLNESICFVARKV